MTQELPQKIFVSANEFELSPPLISMFDQDETNSDIVAESAGVALPGEKRIEREPKSTGIELRNALTSVFSLAPRGTSREGLG